MLSGIKEMAAAYDTVQLRWIRSHTNGSSLAELGNSRADNLAKAGLAKAFELVELAEDEDDESVEPPVLAANPVPLAPAAEPPVPAADS